ncbi:MAG: carboxylesterase family protein, partial [Bacteroidota bacterium]|nr:carboxylesterase family protein [Bacteroidota bacterium]
MKPLSRRKFIASASLASAGIATGAYAAFPFSSPFQNDYVTTETSHGRIRGIRLRDVNIYKGIPYAGRVSGNRRFLRPAPLEPWTGIRDALQLGPPSIQAPNQTYGINEPKPDEDCLFLNVWTPANDNRKRPVMFYNHGGGFATGSGGSEAQDGTNLARNFDVVVVETNHRLGLLGYLFLDEVAGEDYKGSGNNGLLDIIDGLKWVNANISMFGGNPENVMIFGESGGGAKTSCLYAMPDATAYFNKASIESGPGIRMIPEEVASETTALLFRQLNISPSGWQKLLELPASDLLELQVSLPKAAGQVQNQS